MSETTPARPGAPVKGDRYELLRHLGEAGAAALYLARDKSRGTLVVLKTAYPRLKESPQALAQLTQDLADEAKVLSVSLPAGAFAQFDPGPPGGLPQLAISLVTVATPAQPALQEPPTMQQERPAFLQTPPGPGATVAYVRKEEKEEKAATPAAVMPAPSPSGRVPVPSGPAPFMSVRLFFAVAVGLLLAALGLGLQSGRSSRPEVSAAAGVSGVSATPAAPEVKAPPVPGLPPRSPTDPVAPVCSCAKGAGSSLKGAPPPAAPRSTYDSIPREQLIADIAKKMSDRDYATAEAMVDELLSRNIDDKEARFYKSWLDGTR